MRKTVVLLLLLGLVNAVAFAGLDPGGFSAMWGATGTEHSRMNTMEPTPNGDGSFTLSETWDIPGNCIIDLDMIYDPDPYVIAGLSVTNNAAFAQTFIFSFTAPVNPSIPTASYYGGSVGGSYTIDGTDGMVSTVMGKPFYMGRIDGVGVLPFHADSSLWSAAAGESGLIAPVNSPLTNVGPAVASEIQIVYNLMLTPGETVTVNGNFAVVPIPEPAAIAIVGLGSVLLRRRNK